MSSPSGATSSDAPVQQVGTRTRSGNAMHRTRTAILEAAAGCVERSGVRRTTMGDVAAQGGVAKATLYNHFRTKDDVLRALVDSRVAALGEACTAVAAASGLAAALEHAAARLAEEPALRKVAADQPALLLPLVVPGGSRGWDAARAAVVAVLAAAGVPSGAGAVDAVLRWLDGQLLWPATPDQARLEAAVLQEGLLRLLPPVQAAALEPAAVEAAQAEAAQVEATVVAEPVVPEPVESQAAVPRPAVSDPGAHPVAVRSGLGWPAS